MTDAQEYYMCALLLRLYEHGYLPPGTYTCMFVTLTEIFETAHPWTVT